VFCVRSSSLSRRSNVRRYLISSFHCIVMATSVISVEYRGRVAVLTIDNPSKLNALNQLQYYELAEKLREVAEHEEVFITLLIGKGKYFSASVL
jgi:enoyl-CoA hydratase/carnithine racemase